MEIRKFPVVIGTATLVVAFLTTGALNLPANPVRGPDDVSVGMAGGQPQEIGACCDSAGSCYLMEEADCILIGGLFAGPETSCDPSPCDTCDFQSPGDLNGDGQISTADITSLVALLVAGAPGPTGTSADPSGDCCVDWRDVKTLADSIYWNQPIATCTCRDPKTCVEPPPDRIEGNVFHNTDGYVPSNGSPLHTNWLALYPDNLKTWDMVRWFDNGDGHLSHGDVVYLNVTRIPADTLKETVIAVMPTLTLAPSGGGDLIYLDLISPENPMIDPTASYWGSLWREIYPNFARKYQMVSMTDLRYGRVHSGNTITLQALNGPDSAIASGYSVLSVETSILTEKYSCCDRRGDINHDGSLEPDIADLVRLVTFMFQGGLAPACDEASAPVCPQHYYAEADVDGNGSCYPDIADLVWLVLYMFQDGPALVPCP